jgi:hypothetical protein
VLDAEPAGEGPLELAEARSERQLPGAERLEHELLLTLADHRPGERDSVGHSAKQPARPAAHDPIT